MTEQEQDAEGTPEVPGWEENRPQLQSTGQSSHSLGRTSQEHEHAS